MVEKTPSEDGMSVSSGSDGGVEERPNQFTGHESTWRTYTEAERALAASLDQQRAGDLSIHLYNAHMLKARLRDHKIAVAGAAHHNKRRWIKPNADGSRPWYPGSSWTAWPLPKDSVPRPLETFGTPLHSIRADVQTIRTSEDRTWASDLEEEVQALILRVAKENFFERQRRKRIATQSDSPTKANHRERPEVPNGSANTQAAGSSGGIDVQSPEATATTLAFLADDEAAAPIVQPSVQNILDMVDRLLVALQTSRQGQIREAKPMEHLRRARSQSRPNISKEAKSSNGDESDAESDPEQSNEPGVDFDHESNGEFDPNLDGELDRAAENGLIAGDIPFESENESSTLRPGRVRPLHPRDWSEILGLASLAGWNSSIISRAQQRCEALFGERIDFYQLHKNSSPVHDQLTGQAERSRPMTASIHDAPPDEGSKSTYEPLHCCPIADCVRHGVPYGTAWRLREHLKRSHKWTKPEIEQLDAESAVTTNNVDMAEETESM